MTDESHPDRPARAARPVRVARFDSLGAATGGESRVAGFDDLDPADGDRPLARVISLDSVAGRWAPESRQRPVAPADDDGIPPDRPLPRGRRGRRRGEVSDHRPDDSDSSNDVRRPAGDGGTIHDAPPDGPLPRGRRGRARVGRLGPDAPDPELVEPAADPAAIAREICLRLLTDRARTRQELAQALARKGVPADAAASVLDRFGEVGLIDDAAFAGQWVRSRHEHRGLGRRAIAVELRRKGVADDVAGEALSEVDTESEDRRARELVDRKLRSLVLDAPDQRTKAARRLVGMLARKGYNAGTAYRVVKEALADHGAEPDELGTDVPGE
jgi:regulatory protein